MVSGLQPTHPESIKMVKILKITLCALLLAVVTITLHEVSHVLAAVALGVRCDELTVGLIGVNPCIFMPDWLSGVRLSVVQYSGGTAAGLLWLALYLFYWMPRYRHGDKSPHYWLLGAVLLMLAASELATGYVEGYYNDLYMAVVAGSPTHGLIDNVIGGTVAVAMATQLLIFPVNKIRPIERGVANVTSH